MKGVVVNSSLKEQQLNGSLKCLFFILLFKTSYCISRNAFTDDSKMFVVKIKRMRFFCRANFFIFVRNCK